MTATFGSTSSFASSSAFSSTAVAPGGSETLSPEAIPAHWEEAGDILRGAIDCHMHTAPDIFRRSVTDLEAARQAQQAGMRAIVVKSHTEPTGSRAQLASAATRFAVFGGVALNHAVGGFNAHAVDCAIRTGARIVWMPTWNAAQYLKHVDAVPMFKEMLPPGVAGLTVLDERGELLPEANRILELAARHDLALGTGHLSRREGMAVLDAALATGVRRVVITHATADFLDYSLEDMVEASRKGAFIEHNWVFTTRQARTPCDPRVFGDAIRAVGADRTILATDGGQAINPPPVEMFRAFVATMLALGITREELIIMTHVNPAALLAL